jgi:hypothetical protein
MNAYYKLSKKGIEIGFFIEVDFFYLSKKNDTNTARFSQRNLKKMSRNFT